MTTLRDLLAEGARPHYWLALAVTVIGALGMVVA